MKMGTNQEAESEPEAKQIAEETGPTEEEKETPAEHPQDATPPEDVDPLNTYKWHTGAKAATLDGTRGDGGVTASTTIEKVEKTSTTRWSNKMQNWRKALSEDPGERASTVGRGGETPRLEKNPASRKNPFRRAQSEPPGSLFTTQSPSSSAQATSGPGASAEAPEPSLADTPQKGGGGALFRKYIRTVSQKLKRPRLLGRNSTPTLLQECSPDHMAPTGGPRLKGQDGGVRGLIKRRFYGGAMRKSNTQLNTVGLNKGSRLHGSRESVSIPVSAAGNLDLSADTSTVIRPVHSSILGEKYCFEVINSENNHCFGCTSAAERDRWIEDLRRAAQPNKDNCERTENSLSLWVNEAKDLLPKRRYYCELHLDGTLFARTSSRAVGKSSHHSSLVGDGSSGGVLGGSGGGVGGCQLFWGEFFELDNLPSVSQITLHLFRDEDPKKKRHSRDESTLHPLGSVAISLADIRGRAFQEKWHPIIPYKASGAGGTKEQLGPQASLRVKARFQNLQVLPIERYKEFAEFVTVDYVGMCRNLQPLLSVRKKEELAGALVHVLQSIGKAKEFLIELGSAEVERLGEKEALIFRENTLATKAIDEYMKLVGQKYLIDTLGDFITRLYASVESCEVDPLKCPASELSNNQRHLKESCEEAVQKITEMHGSFPEELNRIFSSWVELCEEQGRPEIGQRLISASLFLRFLCPAILSPSLFGLTQPYPEPATLRTLTFTAKVIQNLANFTLFGEKEEYMLFMNDFLQQHWERMRCFLQTVSSPDIEIPMTSFDGYVDLPLRLAVLHSLLVDIISPMKQDTIDKLHPLPSILNQITESLGPDALRITVSSNIGHSKPTYVPPKDVGKYSPLHNSLQQLPMDVKGSQRKESFQGVKRDRMSARERKPVSRTQSAPHRRQMDPKQQLRRQSSTENLPPEDQEAEQEANPPLDISSPQNSVGVKAPPAPVPWIKVSQSKETCERKVENEEINLLDRHAQELSELRLGLEQVTESELEMAKRLEDFIVQSQDQNAVLLAEVNELRNHLAVREEQLASATFRLGVIEEEREEDERKLNVAVAAAERMNVLEEQFADLLKDRHQLSGDYTRDQSNTQYPGIGANHVNSI
ncbi:disabled homolog 2-interacting protein-like isoform X4 [Oncorhynchus clarkii lewisi]|uniref:disabled homolog 2-interacting protein-like isoform X4 n=1 Tax=Oncorhynchus clarkii lewisi TaxID=490388 RepID=UPI0039B94526